MFATLTRLSNAHHQATGFDQASEADRPCHAKLIDNLFVAKIIFGCNNYVTSTCRKLADSWRAMAGLRRSAPTAPLGAVTNRASRRLAPGERRYLDPVRTGAGPPARCVRSAR